MAPTLQPGDRVLVWRGLGPLRSRIRVGDLVAVVDPRQADRLMIKRVVGRTGPEVFVRGDNDAASTDSRHFGPITRDQLVGQVRWRYWHGR